MFVGWLVRHPERMKLSTFDNNNNNNNHTTLMSWLVSSSTFFLATTTAAATALLYHHSKLKTTRLQRILSRSIQKDYPLWIGSFWFLSKQQYQLQQTQPSTQSIWQVLSDTLLLGVLLTLKTTLASIHDDDDDDKNNNRNHNHGDQERKHQKNDSRKKEDKDAGVSNKENDYFETIPPELQDKPTPSSFLTMQQQQQPTLLPKLEPPIPSSVNTNKDQRYLELLVHNVSHTDLVLSIDAPFSQDSKDQSSEEYDKYCLCRPRFSAFDGYSRRVLASLGDKDVDGETPAHIFFPRYERSDATPRYRIKAEPTTMEKLPIGFALNKNEKLTVTAEQLSDLRVRGRDAPRIQRLDGNDTHINAVFFPLLAMLLPQWYAKIHEKYSNASTESQHHPKKVLMLVSGVGTPRNWTHSIAGNSTETCADVMKRFVQTLYPELVVVQVHSNTNIFRYDENITFVQQELMPCIQSYRDAHAKGLPYPDETTIPAKYSVIDDDRPFSTEWKKSMNVTLSFADGSPARNHAIQAALRAYKPTYFHCWQLKTFWHESKIVDSDIEVHSFEEMETLPPIDITNITKNSTTMQQLPQQLNDSSLVLQVVKEMKAFRNEMMKIMRGGNNDIQKFWLRKSHKPVLAVLAVQQNGAIKMYRGTNMEVSMPTGSLCAERNVIGTALAQNPSLRRQDLKMVAVLSVPPFFNVSRSTSTVNLAGLNSDEEQQLLLTEPPTTFRPKTHPRSTSTGSEEEEWVFQDSASFLPPMVPTLPTPPISANSTPTMTAAATGKSPPIPGMTLEPSAASTPARRIHLYNHSARSFKASKHKRTVIVHSDEVR